MNYGSSSEDLPGLCADATSSSPNTSSLQQQQPSLHIPHNGSSSSLSSKVMPPSLSSSILDSEVGAAYPLGAHHNHVDSAVPCSITSNGVKASSSAAVLPNVRFVLYSSKKVIFINFLLCFFLFLFVSICKFLAISFCFYLFSSFYLIVSICLFHSFCFSLSISFFVFKLSTNNIFYETLNGIPVDTF